jgi:hypothetical protein
MARKTVHKSTIKHARDLYLTGEFTQEYIAEICNVNGSTVGKWKEEGNWDEARDYEKSIVENYRELLEYNSSLMVKEKRAAVENDTPWSFPDNKNIGHYLNYIKQKDLTFEQATRIITGFVNHIASSDLALSKSITEHGKNYLKLQEKTLRK